MKWNLFFLGHDFSFWFNVRFHAREFGARAWFFWSWSHASDTVGQNDIRKLWHEARLLALLRGRPCEHDVMRSCPFFHGSKITQPSMKPAGSRGARAYHGWWLCRFILPRGMPHYADGWRKGPCITRTSCPLDEALLTFWPTWFEAKLFLEVRILPGPR